MQSVAVIVAVHGYLERWGTKTRVLAKSMALVLTGWKICDGDLTW
jgi:hypothetical protein